MNDDITASKFLKLLLLGMFPEILIGFIFMTIDDGSWQTFGITLAVIYGVYFLIWLKNTIWEWVLFAVSGREEMKNSSFNFLKENNFPEPDIYSDTMNDYLESIANNHDADPNIRVKAALQLGVIGSIAQLSKYQRALRVSLGMTDGFKKYRDTFENGALSNNEPLKI